MSLISTHLIVHCPERLQEVRDFADRTGQRKQFEEKLEWLVGTNEQYYHHLYEDFAPMSFYWEMTDSPRPALIRDHRLMNGGLIYHGALEDGSRKENFSVRLVSDENPWSIHT